MNSIQKLSEVGQSVWLDFIQRQIITSGELKRMVKEEGLKGVTSNPAIFEKAVTSGLEYDDFLSKLNAEQILRPVDLYEALAIRDLQDAADIFFETYQATQKHDGYVSLEVSPHLALDAAGTLEEARRLWARVNRPNVMIKVPATPECIPVIQQLITDGINVNVTLLFSQKLYAATAEAFVKGLEARAAKKLPLDHVASVASFFISRIDSAVDKVAPKELGGKAAIANAKLTYRYHQEFYGNERWKKLATQGAQVQRLLWASTSTKDPAYRDVLYVEELAGKNTVNTLPPATYKAFLDHGVAKNALEADLPAAEKVMKDLKTAGVDFDKITAQLLSDGIKLFVEPFDKMLKAIETKHAPRVSKVDNLWDDAKSIPWLGWLDVFVNDPLPNLPFEEIAEDGHLGLEPGSRNVLPTLDSRFRGNDSSVVLLGMGGSSLAPDVMNRSLGPFKKFHVIDSTDPEQIAAIEAQVDLKNTLFIVSSKSGSTLEPNIFFEYFFDKVKNPKQFVAITDPGSALEKLAQDKGLLAIYPGVKSIGGRYSALSNFGLVPAMFMGADLEALLEPAKAMREQCMSLEPNQNPGARLGLTLGHLALKGRDKVTLIASKRLEPLGDWVEQLIAESTGKLGKGLVPIVNETVGEPEVYGADRAFVYTHLAGDDSQEKAVEALERAGHPVFRVEMADINQLGAEFYRWEIATALASKVIGINAFDQPDVEAAKVEARRLMEMSPRPTSGGPGDENWITGQARDDSLEVQTLIDSLKAGDYFAIQAFVPMNPETRDRLQKLRMKIRDSKKVATTLGFGPRFLHSTGQLHKGGPGTGVFLQVVSQAKQDLQVPGRGYSFDQVKHAQALGDFNVLKSRNRRVISIPWETLCKLG